MSFRTILLRPSGGKRCSYLNCPNSSSSSNLLFFTFPVKDQARCNLWIINSGWDDYVELPEKKLQHRTLCATHFKDSSFTNSNRNKLLRNHPDAVPVPWFETSNINVATTPPSKIEIPEVPSSSVSANEQTGSQDTSTASLTCDTEETLEQFHANFQPLSDTPVSNPKTIIAKNNESPTPRKKKLLKTLSQKRTLLKRSRNKINFMTKNNSNKYRHTTKELMNLLSGYLSGDTLTFVLMQLNHQHHRAWDEKERNLALSIYYKSPSTYRFLRERGFKLPCVTLIRKWINVYNVETGFSNEVISKLTKKVASMTIDEKQCVLMMDEMSIKKALEYDQKSDLIEGFEDLGPLGRTTNVASHALLFMVRGLKYQWKCPFAYVLSHNSVKSSSLALLLDMCVEKLFKTGLNVRAVVCDQGSTNAAAVRLMGVTEDKPYFFFNNKKIHFIFDVPHLMKCVRNNLINHDIEFNDKTVSWRDIRTFYDLDKNSPNDCRAAPKLSERHLNPHNFQKMSVKLATQVLSASVSRGILAACSLGIMQSSSGPNTAHFLGRLNDIFDCLNSKYCEDPNPLRRPLSSYNQNVIKCLEDAIPFVESWTLKHVKQNPPCFSGLVMSIRSVLSLYTNLKSENNSYLLTGRLNQDPIENTFGVLRQRGGYNSNPSAKQFRRNLQHVMSIRLMDPPGSSNCEPDNDLTLDVQTSINEEMERQDTTKEGQHEQYTNPFDEHENKTEVIDIETSYKLQPECMPGIEKTTLMEDNVICYIGGWLVKKSIDKYACVKCASALLQEGSLEASTDVLIKLKAFTCHTGELAKLHRPTDQVYNIVHSQIMLFSSLYKQHISQRGLHDWIFQIIKRETDKLHNEWFASECKEHRLYMLAMLVKCKIYYNVKWHSNDLRDKARIAISKKRQTCQKSEHVKINKKFRNLKHL